MKTSYKSLNRQVFQIGNCKIIPIRFKDRFDIMKWRNDQIYHLRQSKLLNKDSQNLYFKNVISKLFDEYQPVQILFSFLENDICIGYGGLVHLNWIDKNAEISFVLNTKLEQNKFNFYWCKYLELIELVAFKELFLHKIFTYAYDLRPELFTTLENCGYRHEAILKEHCLHKNKFIDIQIHEKRNSFKLIKLNKNHIQLLFKWVNDSSVRNNAINSEQILWENHVIWFSNKLKDENSKIFIFKHFKDSIGQIRLDKSSNNYWLITYSIGEKYRRMGYGTMIVKLILIKHETFKFKAIVKSNNYASQRVFEKLGFVKKTRNDDNIIEYNS